MYDPTFDPNLPADNQHIDDDPTPEYVEPDEDLDDQDTPPLPTTHEEVLQNLEHNGENANFLRSEAHKHGVDMDEDLPDQFNRNQKENEL